MKYFLDTEFHEYQKKQFFGKPVDTIELISIGIVNDRGETFYAISKEFDVKAAYKNEWLRDNVLEPIRKEYLSRSHGDYKNHALTVYSSTLSGYKRLFATVGKSKEEIKNGILHFMRRDSFCGSCPTPEFYAYYADYDWVVFCWLFGRMIDLPKGMPMYCKDLKQMMDEKGLDNQWKAKFVPQIGITLHNALEDAKWNRELYKMINKSFNKSRS